MPLNIKDLNPFDAIKTIKREFLKLTVDHSVQNKIWKQIDFDGAIINRTKWMGTDNYENYLNGGNKIYGLDDIVYEWNEYGYRTSTETNHLNSDNLIACFGCSHTAGLGVSWEDTWPSQLNQKLGNEYVVKNYGSSGGSNDMICRLIYNYVIKHKPKIICCFLPDIFRSEFFDPDLGEFTNFMPSDRNFSNRYSMRKFELYSAYRKTSTEENCMYNFIKNLKFIEMICKTNNIKFYWLTWAYNINFANEEFIKNYLNEDSFIQINLDEINKNLDMARDGKHFGKKTFSLVCDKFCKKIKTD